LRVKIWRRAGDLARHHHRCPPKTAGTVARPTGLSTFRLSTFDPPIRYDPRMFISHLQDNPLFFFTVMLTTVVSIVLHELAHGVAAIWQGDDTPRTSGHMTLNPVVHMGWMSVAMLVVTGMAFGLMPVNPHRFRSRHGDAIVSAAGPATNLLLALISLTGLGLWVGQARMYSVSESVFNHNAQYMLWIFGTMNLALAILNLLPIPPLDGSAILASFNRGFADFVARFRDPQVFFVALLAIITLARYANFGLFENADKAAVWYLIKISGKALELHAG
jgi:Zn-dependent protease